jgi:hypothetical protein
MWNEGLGRTAQPRSAFWNGAWNAHSLGGQMNLTKEIREADDQSASSSELRKVCSILDGARARRSHFRRLPRSLAVRHLVELVPELPELVSR